MEGFAVALAKAFRGTTEEKARILKALAGGTVTVKNLSEVCIQINGQKYGYKMISV